MIRIVIAEDQQMILGVLGSLLDLEEDMQVVGMARNGEEAISLVHQYQPDVCIMDIYMPGKNGLEAAELLIGLETKVIILTTFGQSGNFQRAVNSGVSAYLLKDDPSDKLAQSIRDVIAGKKIYAPELIDEIVSEGNSLINMGEDKPIAIVEGQTTNQLSKSSAMSNYISHLFDKLEITNRKKAVIHSGKKAFVNK